MIELSADLFTPNELEQFRKQGSVASIGAVEFVVMADHQLDALLHERLETIDGLREKIREMEAREIERHSGG